jgi:hypothetical protein
MLTSDISSLNSEQISDLISFSTNPGLFFSSSLFYFIKSVKDLFIYF